jgi:hypothetical protein
MQQRQSARQQKVLDEFSSSVQDDRAMHSRREFLQAGIAASIVPIAMPAHAIAFDTRPAARIIPAAGEFFSIVYDVRFDDAALLAAKAERAGLPVTRMTGDITDFWFNELSLKWRQAPVAIAGLTGPGALFCLERLGWDHGMRVTFRGVHRVGGVDLQAAHSDAAPAGEHEELLSWVIAPKPRPARGPDAGSQLRG